MIYFRLDANATIGAGHIMRCISIGKQLIKMGKSIIYLVSDIQSVPLLESNSLPYKILQTNWENLDNNIEFSKLKRILSSEINNILIADSYRLSNAFFNALEGYAKLVYLDDLFEEIYNIDLLINYNIYQERFDYAASYPKKKLLLGTKYVPLREQFINSRKNISHSVNKILLMSGGGDPFKILPDILSKAIEKNWLQNIEINVVAGTYNPAINELQLFAKKYANIKIHCNVNNMAELMKKCDIAISAGGTTLYECCAVGLPVIFFCMVDNQKYDNLYFAKAGLLYAGDTRYQRKQCVNNIFSALQYLIDNKEARLQMTEKVLNIVDGLGAVRIAEAIARL